MLLHEPFDFHARSRADYLLAKVDDAEWTYGQGRERSLLMASALIDFGVASGDRVATIMNNSLDALLMIYAAARIGAVCVPLNCRLAPREWAAMIEDAEARIVVADPNFCATLDDADGNPRVGICSKGERPGWLGLEDVLARASSCVPPTQVAPEAPVLQLYTSGTTGRPKGAMLSHRGILSDISQISFAVGNCRPGQPSLHVLPFFHVAGAGFALRAICGGEALVIVKTADPAILLRTLIEERISYTFLVPTIIQRLIDEPGIDELRFPHLHQILYGASPIAEHVLVRAMRVFGCGFLQGFGMTELSCAGSFLTEGDHARALVDRGDLLASVGRPLPGTEMRIVQADGSDCPSGEVGEILIRGPQVFLGYWKLPEATAMTLRDGWLHSGDAGFLNDDGYLFIRDRIKDMIISGGENVYPAEVEAVLHQHPKVSEVAVIGVPDEHWGETVMAVIVSEKNCAITEQELDLFCRSRLGGFKLPRRYSFVASLPRNASGKVLKRDLRAAFKW